MKAYYMGHEVTEVLGYEGPWMFIRVYEWENIRDAVLRVRQQFVEVRNA
jgi:hypothetical protein